MIIQISPPSQLHSKVASSCVKARMLLTLLSVHNQPAKFSKVQIAFILVFTNQKKKAINNKIHF